MKSSALIYGNLSVPTVLYSPWLPRGGDNAVFTVEIVSDSGLTGTGQSALYFWPFHKNTNDVGDGSAVSAVTPTALSTVGFHSLGLFENIKELVRFKIQFDAGSFMSSMEYRMLAPTWFKTVSA